jgi:hypothetical protein
MFNDSSNRRRLLVWYFALLFIWMVAFTCSPSGNLFVRVAEAMIVYSVKALASLWITYNFLGLKGVPQLIVAGMLAHYSSSILNL